MSRINPFAGRPMAKLLAIALLAWAGPGLVALVASIITPPAIDQTALAVEAPEQHGTDLLP